MEGFGQPHGVRAFQSTIHNFALAITRRVLTRKIPISFKASEEQLKGMVIEGKNMIVDTERFVPKSGIFECEMNPVFKLFAERLEPTSACIAYDQFIGKYAGPKKLNYLEANEIRKREGFKPSHAHIRAFIKYEKDCRELKPDRIPRVISPAGFVYLLETGIYITPVEEKIYEAINMIFGYRVVAKGLNYDTLADLTVGHWRSFLDPVFIDLDVEKLDASIFPEALKWTHSIVSLCYPKGERDRIMELLAYQLQSIVKGRANDGSFSYRVRGTLTSGQMNTSLVGVLVVTSILYPLCKRFNIKLVNMGDDCRLIMERRVMPGLGRLINERCAKFCMIVTMDKGDNLFKTQFCQTQLIETAKGIRTVRILKSAISKDSTCIDDIRVPHKLAAWMLAVGQGGLATHGGLPIFDAFYRCMVRNAHAYFKKAKLSKRQLRRVAQFTLKRKFIDWAADLDFSKERVCDVSRVGMFKTFGVTLCNQAMIEQHFDKLVFDFGKFHDRTMLFEPLRCLF